MLTGRRLAGLLALLVCACGAIAAVTSVTVTDARILDRELPPVTLAFWGFLVLVGGWILKGLEVAGRVSLQVLAWSVKALWAFATTAFNFAKAIGTTLAAAGRQTWRFLRFLYAEILRPAWQKFWTLVDRVRGALERIFRPILDFLETIRTHVLRFYEDWIRPILDTIGAARRILQILGSLGVEWARELDRQLARLHDLINRPFLLVLEYVNRAINAVNRIMDGNGLFQRLVLIRSIERDLAFIYNAWQHARSTPLTDEERAQLEARNRPPAIGRVLNETERYLETGAGPVAELIAELDLATLTLTRPPRE